MDIGDPRNGRNAPPQLLRHPPVRGAVSADHASVDLRREPEIENLGDHVGGLEIEYVGRKRGWQHFTELTHVICRWRMSLLQRHQDHPVVDVDGRPVGEGEVVRSFRDPEIVDDEIAFPLRDDLADLVFDLLEDALRGFDARVGRGTDVKLDLAAVDRREEVAANKGEHDAAQRKHQRGDDGDDSAPFQEHRERAEIAAAKSLESALEALVKARKPVARARRCVVMFTLEQQPDDDGRQGPRQRIRRQHGEHHSKPKRREEEFRRPFQEHHRCEHAADRQRRDHGGDRDAGGAVQGCRRKGHPFTAQPVSVLDRHRRIVDENADRERHAAEGHCVERVAEKVQDDDGCQDRQRN